MQKYGVREVQKLLRLPRSTLRALVAAGIIVFAVMLVITARQPQRQ